MTVNAASVTGDNIENCQGFPIAIPTGTGNTAVGPLTQGSYYVSASVGCWYGVGASSFVAAVPSTVAAGGTQPSRNGVAWLDAGVPAPLGISGTKYLSCISPSGTGELRITGPLGHNKGP